MILLALNELNLDYIKGYIGRGSLNNFKKLLDKGVISTTSEDKYELLEPWIQWVTVHTGKSFSEHNVFRLGDIIERPDLHQLFDEMEDLGLSIGVVSPFNAANRLSQVKFFIPDPWTQTKSSGNFLIKKLSKTISHLVNTNATGNTGKLDIIWLFLGFVVYVRFKRWLKFFKLAIERKKPGIKAAILDMILSEVFLSLQKKHKPDYSHIFFNGGAHIQHHYMFNSSQYKGEFRNPEWYCSGDWDPLLMILETYDSIIGDLLETGERIVGITGLHQVPHEEQTFYWRPLSHKDFLIECGIEIEFDVVPRMSRDFLIYTSNDVQAAEIESHLGQFVDSVRLKPVFKIDNRGSSLFIEIVFDTDLVDSLSFNGPKGISIRNLNSKLGFVAIKNGKHHGTGYVFSNLPLNIQKKIDLKELYNIIIKLALQDSKNNRKNNIDLLESYK